MENLLKLLELFSTIVEQNNLLVEQNNQILHKIENLGILPKQIEHKKFDIHTQKRACKVLNCSTPTLKKAIDNNTLIEDIHYRRNAHKNKYFFSSSALEQIKGKI